MQKEGLDAEPKNQHRAQFNLASIFTLIGFTAFLLAAISQRSALGMVAWSIVGGVYACLVRTPYLRRSLLCFFVGVGMIAVSFLHPFAADFYGDAISLLGFLPMGGILALAGGLSSVANVFGKAASD